MADYRRSSMSIEEEAMGELADGTGGTFFHDNNDLDAGFKAITRGTRSRLHARASSRRRESKRRLSSPESEGGSRGDGGPGAARILHAKAREAQKIGGLRPLRRRKCWGNLEFRAGYGQTGSDSDFGGRCREKRATGYARLGALWPRASSAPVTRLAAWRTTFSSLAKSPVMHRTPSASMRSMSALMGEAFSAA